MYLTIVGMVIYFHYLSLDKYWFTYEELAKPIKAIRISSQNGQKRKI